MANRYGFLSLGDIYLNTSVRQGLNLIAYEFALCRCVFISYGILVCSLQACVEHRLNNAASIFL